MPRTMKPKDWNGIDVRDGERVNEKGEIIGKTGSLICGANARLGRGYCHRPAMQNGRCDRHGGKARRGVGSALFKNGKYSKYMPERMMDAYKHSLNDVDLLALREEISLLDARLSDVLSRVDTGESGRLWDHLKEMLMKYNAARTADDEPEMTYYMGEMRSTIEDGAADHEAWHDVRMLIQERRKVVESERRRLLEMQQYVSTEQAMTLVSALIESVRSNVTDPKALGAISRQFSDLIQPGTQRTMIPRAIDAPFAPA